ncbi:MULTISPECIES: hypothetical protein [Vibrio]|uniref:hypothetical protein n=1 Tax=Vibrio TaxID=662 RepID=UPI00057154EF|nr:hypothetical protein [Vibrio pacinii]
MLNQSKILVWYQVASQKVILGEALNNQHQDLISRWLQAPEEPLATDCLGYRLSLYDDDGREIGGKSVSMLTADEFLSGVRVQI